MALFRDDVEMGKKDDDHKPDTRKAWRQRRLSQIPPRRSVKRFAILVILVIGIWYFGSGILFDMSENEDLRIPPVGSVLKTKSSDGIAATTKPADSVTTSKVERTFNGPIKFYDLADTLHIAERGGGGSSYNMNVLFAAASLKSAALLLPIACEMAIQERNTIHFAFLGRDDIPIDLLKSVNGINRDCKIMFHDARPDFAAKSTDFRMEVSCSAAFNHINTYVHPQATIVDGSGAEELYFMAGVHERANSLDSPIVELPANIEQNLMWITLLDSHSLAAWNKVTFDIIVHAQPSTSGSLIRLLESLKKADYFTSALPRLTIELPHDTDEPTKSYLRSRFRWPPKPSQDGVNLLTLHHRIPQHGLTPEENSIRFLESFWPADPDNHHVVVLSPNVEVSPLYFHYLKYAILEWKYSTRQYDSTKVFGISLEMPQTYLNGTTPFDPPSSGKASAPFLWQAPNSNAMLYLGDRWAEIHDFVSRSLAAQHNSPTVQKQDANISKVYPSWLIHMLNLSRARGYSTIYPNFKNDKLVTLHTDLFKIPEEHKPLPQEKSSGKLGADVKAYIKHQKEQKLVKTGFLGFLKDGGSLPLLADVQTMSFDGHVMEWLEFEERSDAYVAEFRKTLGGCNEKDTPHPIVIGKTVDLFCAKDSSG